MGDPGLHSKFVESQQSDYFAMPLRDETRRGDEGLRLDIARAEAALRNAQHPIRRKALRAALEDLKARQPR